MLFVKAVRRMREGSPLPWVWRAAALADPVAAFRWLDAGNAMGTMLREEVSSFEAADLFGRLPADFAARWLRVVSADPMKELVAWRR